MNIDRFSPQIPKVVSAVGPTSIKIVSVQRVRKPDFEQNVKNPQNKCVQYCIGV